jgi:hypothetical protein
MSISGIKSNPNRNLETRGHSRTDQRVHPRESLNSNEAHQARKQVPVLDQEAIQAR